MELLTVQDVARQLTISHRRVHELCRQGFLDHIALSRKERRFTPAMVEKYIAACTVSKPEPAKRLDTKSSHRLPSAPRKGVIGKTEELGNLRKEIRSLCR
jgi:excisionase family DNA binding protein